MGGFKELKSKKGADKSPNKAGTTVDRGGKGFIGKLLSEQSGPSGPTNNASSALGGYLKKSGKTAKSGGLLK